jgi:hypothetical protein
MVFLVSLGVCDEWGITVSRAKDLLLTAGFWTCYHSKTDRRSDHIRAFSLRVSNTFRVIFFFLTESSLHLLLQSVSLGAPLVPVTSLHLTDPIASLSTIRLLVH